MLGSVVTVLVLGSVVVVLVLWSVVVLVLGAPFPLLGLVCALFAVQPQPVSDAASAKATTVTDQIRFPFISFPPS